MPVLMLFLNPQSGPMKVVNHKTGEEALLNFHAYAYFTREKQRKVQYHIEQKISQHSEVNCVPFICCR